jgi:hypothetical protein
MSSRPKLSRFLSVLRERMLLFVDENGQINMETEGIVEIIMVEIMAFIVHGEPILV